MWGYFPTGVKQAQEETQNDAEAAASVSESTPLDTSRSDEAMNQYQAMLKGGLQQTQHQLSPRPEGVSVETQSKHWLPNIRMGLVHRGGAEDSMTYHTADLSFWSSLSDAHMTVWGRKTLWKMGFHSLGISLLVAILFVLSAIIFQADASQLDPSHFTKICQFLNVFVGLLLGFFMSASVNRWWACAEGFMSILDSIRDLQMQLYGLGVEEAKADKCLRYAVMSSWILNAQLHIESMRDGFEKDVASKMMWKKLASGQGLDSTFCTLEDSEREAMSDIADPSGLLWMWVALLVCRMAEDGEIPGMASPTYGRILNIAQGAHQGIRKVRASISVQAPYIYVQMLSSLVHINNIINALSFGLTSGASFATSLQQHRAGGGFWSQMMQDSQTVLVSFTFSVFGPFIYQALLEVSIAIAQPFGNKDGVIPTWRIMGNLVADLHDGKKMVNRIDWKRPCFNTKLQASSV